MSTLRRELRIKFEAILLNRNTIESNYTLAERLADAALEVSGIRRTDELQGKYTATQEMPLDWQIAGGSGVKIPDQFTAQMRDAANILDMQCRGGGALAEAFMLARHLLIPEGKLKGNRKAAKEMLELGVKPEHVRQAVSDLVAKGMTVVDLWSVSRTAIDLANKPKPQEARKTEFI